VAQQAAAPGAASPAGSAGDQAPITTSMEPFPDGAAQFAHVKDILAKSYYSGDVSDDDLYRGAVQGMLEHVDPKASKWNTVLSPTEVAELKTDLKGEIVGVGVSITSFDANTGYSDVGGVVPGSPAERAGMQAGDVVVSIDGKLYRGHPQIDVIRAIRGKVGETVTLVVLRGDKLLTMPIKRDVVAFSPVQEMMLPGSVGYVHLHGFSERTTPAFAAALDDVSKKGARALVIDLRDNPGGSFDQAVAVASLLVPEGTVVATLKRRGGVTEPVTAKGTKSPVLGNVPMTVLVDHGTSSSAELLAAALEEDRHADVIGSKTFGKWTVQQLEDLSNGWAIKYTTALFTSPSGRAFEGTGLVPDVEVDMEEKAQKAAMLVTDPDKRLAADAPLRTALQILGVAK
jgi:carboxyl-terminal processing protease